MSDPWAESRSRLGHPLPRAHPGAATASTAPTTEAREAAARRWRWPEGAATAAGAAVAATVAMAAVAAATAAARATRRRPCHCHCHECARDCGHGCGCGCGCGSHAREGHHHDDLGTASCPADRDRTAPPSGWKNPNRPGRHYGVSTGRLPGGRRRPVRLRHTAVEHLARDARRPLPALPAHARQRRRPRGAAGGRPVLGEPGHPAARRRRPGHGPRRTAGPRPDGARGEAEHALRARLELRAVARRRTWSWSSTGATRRWASGPAAST